MKTTTANDGAKNRMVHILALYTRTLFGDFGIVNLNERALEFLSSSKSPMRDDYSQLNITRMLDILGLNDVEQLEGNDDDLL